MLIQHIRLNLFLLNSHSVFVVAVNAILEEERDNGEQTLSTPTLQRSHFLRGVVNVFFVCVKAQGVKVVSLRKIEQLLIRAQDTYLRTTHKHNSDSVFHSVCAGQDRIL